MGRKSREKRERREREQTASKWGNFTPYGVPARNYPVQPAPSKGSTDSERLLAEDALYIDARPWTPEMEAEAKERQACYGILTTHKPIKLRLMEYPI